MWAVECKSRTHVHEDLIPALYWATMGVPEGEAESEATIYKLHVFQLPARGSVRGVRRSVEMKLTPEQIAFKIEADVVGGILRPLYDQVARECLTRASVAYAPTNDNAALLEITAKYIARPVVKEVDMRAKVRNDTLVSAARLCLKPNGWPMKSLLNLEHHKWIDLTRFRVELETLLWAQASK